MLNIRVLIRIKLCDWKIDSPLEANIHHKTENVDGGSLCYNGPLLFHNVFSIHLVLF